ncbi:MAG: efflux RND transporter periplasmic adaptor subunit [Terrimicrobiaceae bacterium]
MKKTLPFILVIFAALFFLWKGCRSGAVASEAARQQSEEVKVQRGDITIRVQSTATITPENKLEIKPPIAGRAESVLVDIGAKVTRGQTLAMMSSSERAALLDAARAKGAKEIKFWEDVYKAAPLVAPLDGVIISRSLVPGQAVETSDVVFIMSDHLIAQADMDETDLAKVFIGQKAEVSLDSYPNDKISGDVFKIAYNGTTTNSVTTYAVDVALKSIPAFARSGMTASVFFLVTGKKGVLLLPADAVSKDGTVLLPSPSSGGEPIAQTVTTGLTDGKMIEITGGLKEGQVVLRTAYSLPSIASQGFSILPKPGGKSGTNSSPPPPDR